MADVPATREAAVQALVDDDVARWGEVEREASARMHSWRSLGRALNELANRHELRGDPSPELRRAANHALTPDEWRELRDGG